MPESVTVLAAPGRKVPREDNARKYFSADKPAEVPRTPYIERMLLTGDLVIASAAPAAIKEVKSAKAPKAPTPADPVATGQEG